jgi:hypothetical protein
MTQSLMVSVNASSMNYLADHLIAAYFEAREHESYYRSLKLVDPRRDFHEHIIPVLIDFIGETMSNPNTAALDTVVDAAAAARLIVKPTDQVVAEAKRLHAVGFDLLGIESELSVETLKSLYRRAARKYHPDAGGSYEVMKKVNEAYSLFHELVCQSRFVVSEAESAEQSVNEFAAPIRTAKDYVYVLGLLLLDIKLDDWALDDAHYWLCMLCSPEWALSNYAQHERTRWSTLFECDRLAGLQWAAGRKEESRQAHEYGKEILRASGGAGNWAMARFNSIEKYVEQGEKLRLVLNHRRQADNALRLGLVDQKRYAKTLERLQGKDKKNQRREDALDRYIKEVGFLKDLPTDGVARGKRKQANLVPEPAYFEERVDSLTNDQQAEYLQAFGADASLGLARKYAQVRVNSLLRSMIVHPELADIARIEAECRLLSALHDDSSDDVYSQVANVAQFFSRLAPDDRRARLAILRQLDENSADGPTLTIIIDFESEIRDVKQTDSTFRACSHPDYLEAVRASMNRLQLALRTGSIKTKEEQTRDREIWSRDINLMRSPLVKDSERTVYEASDLEKGDPAAYVKLMEAHCAKLLKISEQMKHVEQAQIGAWIDRLSILLVRLKRWEEAKQHLEAFFALPIKYRGRSSPSSLESMTKRLERCKARPR